MTWPLAWVEWEIHAYVISLFSFFEHEGLQIRFFVLVGVACAAKRQIGSILFERFLFVAGLASPVQGLRERRRQVVECSFPQFGRHRFMTLLAGLCAFTGVVAQVAFQAACIAPQGLLVQGMVEDRSGLLIVCMAF